MYSQVALSDYRLQFVKRLSLRWLNCDWGSTIKKYLCCLNPNFPMNTTFQKPFTASRILRNYYNLKITVK
jgi:hypothetical protein